MRKITKKKKLKLIINSIVLILMLSIIGIIYYHSTDNYKLRELGYTKEEITFLNEEFKNNELVLEIGYNEKLIPIIKEKYFILDNLEEYLSFYNSNKDKSLSDVISIVNVGAHHDWYTNTRKTNISEKETMIVNKYNYLEEDYIPDDIRKVSLMYAYEGREISDYIYDPFISMWNGAKEDGITLIITSGFRDYELQNELYEDYVSDMGREEANLVSAKPGYSEHQSGLALDILTVGVTSTDEFESTEAFEWLKKNSYKYGFILRYPKDKEYLTGYAYEPWHYRYLGKDLAKKVYDSGLTYEEYYAYYIEKR